MAEVRLEKITKRFGDVVAVRDIDLTIRDREFVAFVGPSGCGKSTTLRMIAGLEETSSGDLFIKGRRVNDLAPKDRDIAMVFQSYALYPHMSVFENMAFGLQLRKMSKDEIQTRVSEAARILSLEAYLHRKPRELSGGQRQRVAMGRAIVRQPAVFLFDEPLSNLDAKLRVQMRIEIARLHRQLQSTSIYVTHDQVEAMTLADRIVVMKDGEIQQVGPPMELYHRPANRFVATFLGSPAMNLFQGELRREGSSLRFLHNAFSITLPETWKSILDKTSSSSIQIGIRPQDILLASSEKADIPALPLDVYEPLGAETFLFFQLGGEALIVRETGDTPLRSHGERCSLHLVREHLHLFDPKTGLSLRPSAS